jgi:hypothetical protein
MTDVARIFSNESDVGQLARLVMWNGLDLKVKDTWDWYRSVREHADSAEVLLRHVRWIARSCDEIAAQAFPDFTRTETYAVMIERLIVLLEDRIRGEASHG